MTTPNPFEGLFDDIVPEGATPGRASAQPPPLGGGSETAPGAREQIGAIRDLADQGVRGWVPGDREQQSRALRETAERGGPGTWVSVPAAALERLPPFDPYRRGEEWEPERWPIEDVVALQRHLEMLGLLSGPYRLGYWDSRSASAYSELLAFANQIGGKTVPFDEVVRQFGELRARDDSGLDAALAGMDSFMAPTFRPPNPEAVAQALDQAWQQMVGREMDAAEKARFTAAFNRLQREAHDTEVGVARGEHERAQEEELAALSRETGIPIEALRPDPDAPGALPADTPQTDPQAEFMALVESHLGAEVAGQEQAQDAQASNRLVSGVFADIGRLMQQGGVR